jgi:hypothetical protein
MDNILNLFRKRKVDIKFINQEVRGTLQTSGWKIVEDHLKHMLDSMYNKLLDVKPDELKKTQDLIRGIVEMLQKIYEMGGLEWNYEGYRTMESTVFKDEKHGLSLYEMAVDEAMKVFNKEETNA